MVCIYFLFINKDISPYFLENKHCCIDKAFSSLTLNTQRSLTPKRCQTFVEGKFMIAATSLKNSLFMCPLHRKHCIC